jgi:tRNA (guanine10-N2)-dimethyltransferase
MKRSLFILGRTPDLAFLELQSLYPSVVRLRADMAVIDEIIDADAMQRLGGTIKIVHIAEESADVSKEKLLNILRPHITEGKITFGVSIYGDPTHVPHTLLKSVKEAFAASGVAARYVESRNESILSSVVIAKQHAVEAVIIVHEKMYLLGITAAVQDFEAWNHRDFGRPQVDPHKGMLPPKVARMIANIALQGGPGTLLDPFCGVGTVLSEALLCGASVVGSDIDVGAVAKSQKNIAWLMTEYGLGGKVRSNVFVADATHLSEKISAGSIDAIATEPFMGDPSLGAKGRKITVDQAKNTLKGLEKLYIGCLREWATLLKPGGKMVIALPAYDLGRNVMGVKNVVDRSESLGYTLEAGPIEYSRPQAQVRRQFYLLKKN